MAKKLMITDTILRDAHQSQAATRMRTEDMLPACEILDSIGYYSLECWGGATFDACLRFLNEDPWERLRKLKKALPNTKLQMLFRGQNILGYKHYADDVVEQFCRKAIENGIDVIRIFDALNDVRNLEAAIKYTKKYGGICEPAISYTMSPVHNEDYFVKLAKELVQMGADNICIKDMAGIMTPKSAYDLVSGIKDAVDLPVVLHTHCTTGLAFMTYLKGIEAGADVIDTAISPFSGGTSQPATETLYYALKELGYDVALDEKILIEMANYFKPIRNDYLADGTLNPISMTTDTQCLTYQIPGGMLSNLLSQLKMMNALDKFEEALIETPRVRKDMGYPPLVTPTSQLVGSQAVQNVLAGERYKNVGAEIKAYCRGEYGRTPAPIDEEVRAKILNGEKPIEGRYADTLPTDTYEKAAEHLGDTAKCEEDVLSYIAFPQVAENFFEKRREAEEKVVRYTITEA